MISRKSTRTRFELARALPIHLAGEHLNHSVTASFVCAYEQTDRMCRVCRAIRLGRLHPKSVPGRHSFSIMYPEIPPGTPIARRGARRRLRADAARRTRPDAMVHPARVARIDLDARSSPRHGREPPGCDVPFSSSIFSHCHFSGAGARVVTDPTKPPPRDSDPTRPRPP